MDCAQWRRKLANWWTKLAACACAACCRGWRARPTTGAVGTASAYPLLPDATASSNVMTVQMKCIVVRNGLKIFLQLSLTLVHTIGLVGSTRISIWFRHAMSICGGIPYAIEFLALDICILSPFKDNRRTQW